MKQTPAQNKVFACYQEMSRPYVKVQIAVVKYFVLNSFFLKCLDRDLIGRCCMECYNLGQNARYFFLSEIGGVSKFLSWAEGGETRKGASIKISPCLHHATNAKKSTRHDR